MKRREIRKVDHGKGEMVEGEEEGKMGHEASRRSEEVRG